MREIHPKALAEKCATQLDMITGMEYDRLSKCKFITIRRSYPALELSAQKVIAESGLRTDC